MIYIDKEKKYDEFISFPKKYICHELTISELNNFFHVKFNKISSKQSTNVRLFLPHNSIKRIEIKKGFYTDLAM